MIYLPEEITSTNCAYMYDKDTIRVYEEIPVNNRTIDYTDYFINSHYLKRTGTTTFNNYSTINYDCLDYQDFTTTVAYRNDFPNILIMFLCLVIPVWILLSKLLKTFLFGRRLF